MSSCLPFRSNQTSGDELMSPRSAYLDIVQSPAPSSRTPLAPKSRREFKSAYRSVASREQLSPIFSNPSPRRCVTPQSQHLLQQLSDSLAVRQLESFPHRDINTSLANPKRQKRDTTQSRKRNTKASLLGQAAKECFIIADSIADDTYLGKILEATFADYDVRMRDSLLARKRVLDSAQNNITCSASGVKSPITKRSLSQDNDDDVLASNVAKRKDIEDDAGNENGKGLEEVLDEDELRIHNACARRIQAAIEKERINAKAKLDEYKGPPQARREESSKIAIWRDL